MPLVTKEGNSPMQDAQRTCPDCRQPLRSIRILDATAIVFGAEQGGAAHVELSYSAIDAKPGWFTGAVPREGLVRAWLCPDCGRILLYGEPLAGAAEEH
jgi:hypothetical protein